jgi:hypothetical protein
MNHSTSEFATSILNQIYIMHTVNGKHYTTEYTPNESEPGTGYLCEVVHNDVSPSHSSILKFASSIESVEWEFGGAHEAFCGFLLGTLKGGIHFLFIYSLMDWTPALEDITVDYNYGENWDENKRFEDNIPIADENHLALCVSYSRDSIMDVLKHSTFHLKHEDFVKKQKIGFCTDNNQDSICKIETNEFGSGANDGGKPYLISPYVCYALEYVNNIYPVQNPPST